MRPIGTAADLEGRRRIAIALLNDGTPVTDVAESLGVSVRAVYLWQAAYRDLGDDGLKAQPPPSRPGKLTGRQQRTVLSWFFQSPRSFGFATDLWTGRRVAAVIRRKWGVEFNWRYLLRWLHERGITPQKPQRRPREADRGAIERWRTDDWPRLQNGRAASGPPLFSSTRPAFC